MLVNGIRVVCFVLSLSLVKADSDAQDSFEVYGIAQSDGPYTVRVPISQLQPNIVLTIDENDFTISDGSCHMNASVGFSFPCPVECSLTACVLKIKLPELSFLERLVVKANNSHEIIYLHDRNVCESQSPFYTQKSGPLIFMTLLPRSPKYVVLQDKYFFVDANNSLCQALPSKEKFKCKVEQLAKVFRITIYVPEIKNITEILIGAQDLTISDEIYWLPLKQISTAMSGIFDFGENSFSNLCANDYEMELIWRFAETLTTIDINNVSCYSNEGIICGQSTACVLENEGGRTLLRYTAKWKVENMLFYTCMYNNEGRYDMATYRLLWPGLDMFVDEKRTVDSSSNKVELEWTVNHWGPREHRKLECYADDQLLCAGVVTTPEEGKCYVQDFGEYFVFGLTAIRKNSTSMARFVCHSASAAQERIIFWRDADGNKAKEYNPEYVISKSVQMLEQTVNSYLTQARIPYADGRNDLAMIFSNANVDVACDIAAENHSWSCNVNFTKSLIQLNDHSDEVSFSGGLYEVSGRYSVCAGNTDRIERLFEKSVLFKPPADTKMNSNDKWLNRILHFNLKTMLSKGPGISCGL